MLAACDSPLSPSTPAAEPDIRELVTGEARAALDATGRFYFQWGELHHPVMPRESALEIAAGAMRLFTMPNPPLGSDVIKQHLELAYGGSIDFGRAKADPRSVYLIHSYLEALPDSLPPYALNHWGPWYVVPFYIGGVEVAAVAVAGRSPIRIDSEGRFHDIAGSDLDFVTVPFGRGSSVVVSPERAVDFLARRLIRRLSKVPRLLRPANQGAPWLAAWELTFEREFSVRELSSGSTRLVTTVYLTHYGGFYNPFLPRPAGLWRTFIPGPWQPEMETIHYAHSGTNDVRYLEWPIRPNHPVRWVEVELLPDS